MDEEDLEDLINQYTIDVIEKEFSQVAYNDPEIVGIFKEWQEFIDSSKYEWTDCYIPCLKDTIVRLHRRIVTQHRQLFTTTAN